MNRSEVINEIVKLTEQIEVMQEELKKFAMELSAASQIAIIARMVSLQREIDEYSVMLDHLDFDEIVKDF